MTTISGCSSKHRWRERARGSPLRASPPPRGPVQGPAARGRAEQRRAGGDVLKRIGGRPVPRRPGGRIPSAAQPSAERIAGILPTRRAPQQKPGGPGAHSNKVRRRRRRWRPLRSSSGFGPRGPPAPARAGGRGGTGVPAEQPARRRASAWSRAWIAGARLGGAPAGSRPPRGGAAEAPRGPSERSVGVRRATMLLAAVGARRACKNGAGGARSVSRHTSVEGDLRRVTGLPARATAVRSPRGRRASRRSVRGGR